MHIALHVEQWHAADNGTKELGIDSVHVPHQEAAIAAAFSAKVRARRHATLHQVRCDGGEILVCSRPVCLERRLVPRRTILAAAPDVREHKHPAAIKPCRPQHAIIGRKLGDLESAVAGEQRRVAAIQLQSLPRHLEIRHPCAVFRGHEVLGDVIR